MMGSAAAEDQLIARARTGDADATAELFDRHWRATWRASYAISRSHAVAEDCAQDAFIRAFGALDTYNGSSFRAWVSRIAVNQTLNHIRKDKRLTPLYGDEPDDTDMPMPDAALDRALAGLPLDRRAIVVLRYWLGYEPREIAELLDLPVGTVHSRMHRALNQLRGALEEVARADRA